MPTPLRLVVLVLVLSGLGAFLMGLSLLPTDISRAWLVVGAVFLSGGMVSLALAYATKAITDALAAYQGGDARMAAPAVPAAVAEPVVAAEPAEAEMSQVEPAPSTPSRFGVPGLVAAGGALLGAGVGILAARKASTPEAPEAEATDPDRGEPVAAEAVAPPVDDFETDLFALKAERADPEPDDLPDFSALDLRLSRESAPLPPEPEALLMPEVALAPPAQDDDALEPFEAAPMAEASDHAEAVSLAEAAPAPPLVPGLIADEDLAALQDAPPLLAPLDTLEIVGAYDSGGVRFTMYSDGSVHAAGQEGEKRYPSLQALRERLDSGAPAV